MAGFFAKLRAFLLREPPPPELTPAQASAAADALGAQFRRKHTNFRLLLTSGKRLLSLLADMERAATDGRVFGMAFLRAGATSAAVNAFRMLSHLKALDQSAATRLAARFSVILAEVEEVLGRRNAPACGDLVTDLASIDAASADLVSARLAELGEVKNRLGLPVPEGFVIGACAYEAFAGQPGLREEIARRTQSLYDVTASGENTGGGPPAIYGPDAATLAAMSREVQALIHEAPLPESLEAAINDACERLAQVSGCTRVSVLPSSLGEGQGFTGVYPTQYGVRIKDVLAAYRRALAGKYSVQAMRRRLMRGIPDIDVAICVGVLALPGAVEDWLPEDQEGGLRGAEGECLHGACRTTSAEGSARSAGLGRGDSLRLAELSRRLEQGLGAPALFELIKTPDDSGGGGDM
ncbi:MAG: PEP/pyruvate-binding domain-containing protein, partial [Humidesulfovibrio sp.]|nr:PEP/pyruvate-binding domain-containing protein [Humidesulfovibrio sp.]